MSEKLHNDEYDVKRRDGNAIGGDSNKIKLKMISYAIVMEVQEAFMQEELEKQNEELNQIREDANNSTLTTEEQNVINQNIESLKADIDSMKKVYEEFTKARTRFTEISKRALKVHEDNIKQMKENDKEISEESELKVDMSSYKEAQKVLDDAQSKDIFSSVDSDAIKEEVNRAMNEKTIDGSKENNSDLIAQNITSDNFEETINSIVQDVKATPREQTILPTTSADDIFDNSMANVGVFGGSSSLGGSENVGVQKSGLNAINFDKDKSIEAYLDDLEKATDRLKADGNELLNKISDVKGKQTEATREQERAKKECEEAKARYEEAIRQKLLFNSLKPTLKNLNQALIEQVTINSAKKDELKREKATLAGITSSITALETEKAEYDAKTSEILNELKILREEFAGTAYNGADSPIIGGEGGRKK